MKVEPRHFALRRAWVSRTRSVLIRPTRLKFTKPEQSGIRLPVGAGAPAGSIPMKRIAAPERTRERLRALMDGRLGTAPDRSNLVLLAAQLILEEALEAEVRERSGASATSGPTARQVVTGTG